MRRIIAADEQRESRFVDALFLLYDALSALAVWLLLVPYELSRVALRLASLEPLRQRLGQPTPSTRDHVLIHGASVGEITAAEALVAELARRGSGSRVVLSTTTRSGLEAAARIATRHSSVVACRLLPWDAAGIIRRWLRRERPGAVLVVETELWPNLFRCCREAGIPLAMVSARIYAGDVARYAALRPFFARVLGFAGLIGAQSLEEATRFVAIGGDRRAVAVVGNLKTSVAGASRASTPRLDENARVVVAGCTHPEEETMVFEACRQIAPTVPGLRLVLAPRHVERADKVRRELGTTDLFEVEVIDRVGELRDRYLGASVAFIGGSLVRHGGHNPLEALAAGCPVVMGPHLENVDGLVRPLRGNRAVTIVERREQLRQALEAYLSASGEDRAEIVAAARAAVGARSGGEAIYAAWIERNVRARRSRANESGAGRQPLASDSQGREAF